MTAYAESLYVESLYVATESAPPPPGYLHGVIHRPAFIANVIHRAPSTDNIIHRPAVVTEPPPED